MDKLRTALNAYYDGIYSSRDVIYRADDMADYMGTAGSEIVSIVNRFYNGAIGADDAVKLIGHHVNVVLP